MNSSSNLNELENRSLIPSKTEVHHIGYKFCHMCVCTYIWMHVYCVYTHTHIIVAAQLVDKLSAASFEEVIFHVLKGL